MLDEALIKELGTAVGPDQVLTDDGARDSYSHDATGWRNRPDAVVRPRDAGEVSRVVTLAYENSIPLTPWGAGTGLSGGAVPARGGIVLSTERMNAAPRVHREDLYAEVAAGIRTAEFRGLVESQGLFYPPDPASQARCTIGGNIAECAAGPRRLKYGTTLLYVLGLEVVTPEGKILNVGARTVKSVAGYDLTRLWVGSEGTLGFITSAVLRLLPRPQAKMAVRADFKDVEAACEAANHLVAGGLLPAALEIMDGTCTRAVSEHLGAAFGGGSLLLAEFDGTEPVTRENAERAAGALRAGFNAEVRVEAGPGEARDRIWHARAAVLPALMGLRPTVLLEDVTVPRSKLPAIAGEIRKVAARHNVRVAVFGHAGSGNLHPAFLTDSKDSDEMSRVRTAIDEVMRACVDLEGTVSPGHGVGVDEEPYLDLEIGRSGCEVMRSLKDSLDPKGIMNPGKMFHEN
jgi:glycolate oxidase